MHGATMKIQNMKLQFHKTTCLTRVYIYVIYCP